ncbi:MAG: hypothetical protein HUU20_27200 [Pirellulales bacterium]|nr:hypothetical protein [Pirellulales bacterium]
MISEESKAVLERARQVYESQFRQELEQKHHGRYLSIEPSSGRYFLGDTLDDAVNAALETFTCYLDWFSGTYRTQVVANDGRFPLLGTMLPAGRRLTIDYKAKTVTLD